MSSTTYREPGTYIATFHAAQLAETQNGTPVLETEWQLEDGAIVKAPVYLSDAAWENSEKKLKGAGFNGDFENPSFNSEAELKLKYEEYKGEDKAKWELAFGGNEPASKATVAKLKQRWKASSPVKPPKPSTTKPPVPAKPAGPTAEPKQEEEAKAKYQLPNTEEDVWAFFCNARQGVEPQALEEEWLKLTSKEPSTPEEWEAIAKHIDHDGFPF